MFLNRYLQKASNLFAENRLLKFAVVVLSIGFVWCAYKLEDTKDKVRTIVVPPVLNSKVEISGSWTTDSYVKEYMRYMGALLWNYSPGTARIQFSELLVSWHPSVFDQAKNRLYILADQIEQTKTVSVFFINKIEHNPERMVIEVTGNRRLTQQDQHIEDLTKTYLVNYKVENGRFWIVGVEDKTAGATKTIGSASASVQPNKGEVINAKP